MQRAYNFGAGPTMLPTEVLVRIQNELFDWRNTGVSVMEIGHRTDQFQEVINDIKTKLRESLDIPSNYKIILATGGAQGQFDGIPLNLTKYNQEVDYIVTGVWSQKAADFAKKHARVNIVTTASLSGIPESQEWKLNPQAAYCYYCPNETVSGLAFNSIPDVGGVDLVGDFTSSVASESLDFSKFGVVFASAQKNLGIAGVTLVVIRDDLLNQAQDYTPVVWNYQQMNEQNSSINTGPTFAIYVMDLMLDWIIAQGGVQELQKINKRKSQKLYEYIDASKLYLNKIDKAYRSPVNVVFNLIKEELLPEFLSNSAKHDLKYLAGHKLVGGARASLYNAIPEVAVDELIEFMRNFEIKYQ